MRIKLDREREAYLDLNAMCRFAEVRGYELWQINTAKPTSADLRALVWCALLREEPDLTLEEAGRLLTMENLEDVAGQLMRQAREAMPEQDDESPNPGEQGDGTG